MQVANCQLTSPNRVCAPYGVAERQTSSTWRRINTELRRLHLVTLAGPAGRVEQTTLLTPAQRELFAATGIAPPPRVTSLQPT
jgi:hypothetical protein